MSHRDTQRHRGVLERMDRETVLLLHLLLIKGHFYTGVSTYDTVSVYHKVGDDAILPCGNVVYPNCSSTTWIYNKHSSATTELVGHGKVKGRERAGRLRVGSNCSLHISNVHTEDAGSYTCQQYLHVGAAPYGGDAPVRLSVLSRSPSSPVTELKPGSTVTLHCLLYTPEGPGQCNKDSAKTITLSWVDERDTPLNKSRFKIENWPPCNSTLTFSALHDGVYNFCEDNKDQFYSISTHLLIYSISTLLLIYSRYHCWYSAWLCDSVFVCGCDSHIQEQRNRESPNSQSGPWAKCRSCDLF
ncbi:hypothetical protein JZ751_015420 [Albula glossodonta]|uniref:Ig-like domain-containing protein n=1 Tax=Albula glossodonta TaxID=121402 RepID=A0A8T2MMF7_9TELE|nr:hypothetical protein JZ751_015420 [Albula glossodonta]